MDFWARSNRPRVVVAGAAAASLVIAAAALADPHGVPLLRRLGQDIARQEAANQALREENSRLHRRVRALSVPTRCWSSSSEGRAWRSTGPGGRDVGQARLPCPPRSWGSPSC